MSAGGDSWSYMSADNRQMGPVPKDALLALIAQGRLHGGTLVWREGFDDWRRLDHVEELAAARPAPAPAVTGAAAATNLLTQRLAPAERGAPVRTARPDEPKSALVKKIAFGVLALICLGWANYVWRFLPFSPKPSSEYGTDLPDRWFSKDNKEGAIIQCEFDARSAAGGKSRFRLAVVVSAGRAQNNRLRVDQSDNLCSVVIKNTEGKTVFQKDITTRKLCPS